MVLYNASQDRLSLPLGRREAEGSSVPCRRTLSTAARRLILNSMHSKPLGLRYLSRPCDRSTFVRWTLPLLAILAAACGQAATPVAGPSATAAPVAALSPSAFPGFSCRLPFFVQDGSNGFRGGFISLPTGSASFDPQATPLMLAAGLPPYYDSKLARWLPVSRWAVSPDDAHYAFGVVGDQSHPPTVHIVDTGTGADHVFKTTPPSPPAPFEVFEYAADGLYLVDGWGGEHATIWRMDTSSGAVVELTQPDYFLRTASDHAIWTGHIDQGDSPTVGTMNNMPDRLDLFRITDQSRTTWLDLPGKQIYVQAVDAAGQPIVSIRDRLKNPDPAPQLVLLTGPGHQQTIVTPPDDFPGGWTFADSHGVWFGGAHGIYLFTETGGLRKITDQAGTPAGACT